MARRIVIAGAGGFGQGVLAWLQSSPQHVRRCQINEIVFIDDAPPRPQNGAPVFTTIKAYEPQARDEVICAVGDPQTRRRIVALLSERGARFHTFVDDRAVVAHNVDLGNGTVVCPGSVISANVHLGPHVHVNFNCSIGHDTTIGPFSTLSPAVNIMGEVFVGEGTLLGGSAAVLPRLSVGRDVVVGAGAVVVQDVVDLVTVVGNPASALEIPKRRN